MSGLKGSVAGLALAAAVAGAQAEEPKVTPLGNDQVAATTQAATHRSDTMQMVFRSIKKQ